MGSMACTDAEGKRADGLVEHDHLSTVLPGWLRTVDRFGLSDRRCGGTVLPCAGESVCHFMWVWHGDECLLDMR